MRRVFGKSAARRVSDSFEVVGSRLFVGSRGAVEVVGNQLLVISHGPSEDSSS